MKYEIVNTHITDIKAGDTVEINGKMMAVSKNNIKRDPFMGTTLFGDSYMGGKQLVKKVVIYRAMPGGKFVVA